MIELRTLRWSFDTRQPAWSALTDRAPAAVFEAPADAAGGFTVRLTLDLATADGEADVLEIPGVLQVRLRQAAPDDRGPQNYPAFRMPDGSVPVLEATLTLHSEAHPDWTALTIGLPLAMLEQPGGRHDVVLHFTGVRWTMVVDGTLADNDFPFGYPPWAERNAWKLDPARVREASLFAPALTPKVTEAPTSRTAPVAYWTPPGHNAWVGDVATLFHRGRYHLFYLYDRRHHRSKFGQGAHYFEHLSTADFRTWTEHEAATPLEEQWECIGTGLPFVADGRLCLGYGLHTTRIYPEAQTTLPAQWAYLRENGRTGSFPRGAAPGVPAGSTCAVSEDDDARFRKTWATFHPCENPSVFTDPDGRLRMIANYRSDGIWESESVDGGWRCVHPGFPPGGDCTFFFRWGAFDYLIGGFTDLWMKPSDAPDSAYVSLVAQGLDFYDGSNVPSIAEVPGGRFLMAAWIPIRGWGGPLLLRELVPFPDGRIGSKWMPEAVPEAEPERTLAATLSETATFLMDAPSALLTFTVHPGERLRVAFLPESGEQNAAEWQVRPSERRAQFGPGAQKSLREGGSPHSVGDYAIENLLGVDRPFPVRVIVRHDEKLGGSLIDVEIAGARTMISFRPELRVARLAFLRDGVAVDDLCLAPLRDAPPSRHGCAADFPMR